MEHDDWAAGLAKRIGRRVAYFRERARDVEGNPVRLTAQALADRCAELGHPLDRSVIAKLEKGHRLTVSVADLIVLAKALGVPPPLLVFGLGVEDRVEVLPGVSRATWAAYKWFIGDAAFPTEQPAPRPTFLAGTHEDNQAYADTARPYLEHRQHDDQLIDCFWQAERETVLVELLNDQHNHDERLRLEAELKGVRDRLAEAERDLADRRSHMRRHGIVPPPLPLFLRARLGERSFVVYERFDESGRLAERRTVPAGSSDDHQLAADKDWHPLDPPFDEPPADYVRDQEGEE